MRTRLPIALCLLVACGGDDTDAPPPEPLGEPPPEVLSFFDQLLADAEAFGETDGDWTEDYGDAPFYGLGIYARLAAERGDATFTARSDRAAARALGVVEQANGDRDFYLANMEEAIMSALGLIEHADATGDTANLAAIDAFVDETNTLVGLFSDYLPTGAEVGSFALETYGPTSITGAAALVSLQYATYLDTPQRDARIDRAARIVRAIDRNAWDGERYLFAPGNDRLYLYPNVMMILVQLRLYELTGDTAHLERAVATGHAIAPLEHEERGGYRSPYSAEYMGATTDDYSTLSSQNYLILALLLLHRHTRDIHWFDEAISVVTFVRTRLYDAEQHRLLHHWMDGQIAQPEDREYFCSGCNLQLLYVLWYMRARALAE